MREQDKMMKKGNKRCGMMRGGQKGTWKTEETRAQRQGRDLRDKGIEGGEAAKMSLGKCNDGPQKSDREFYKEDFSVGKNESVRRVIEGGEKI